MENTRPDMASRPGAAFPINCLIPPLLSLSRDSQSKKESAAQWGTSPRITPALVLTRPMILACRYHTSTLPEQAAATAKTTAAVLLPPWSARAAKQVKTASTSAVPRPMIRLLCRALCAAASARMSAPPDQRANTRPAAKAGINSSSDQSQVRGCPDTGFADRPSLWSSKSPARPAAPVHS